MRVKEHLENLPNSVLLNAKVFYEQMQYFLGPGRYGGTPGHHSRDIVPEGLRSLLDDIVGSEQLGERVKLEILQDDDARQVGSAFIRQFLI
jgi:potassium channel subfamily K, other eukaryote